MARERLPSRVAMWCAMHSGSALNVLAACAIGAAWYVAFLLLMAHPVVALTAALLAFGAGMWALRRATDE